MRQRIELRLIADTDAELVVCPEEGPSLEVHWELGSPGSDTIWVGWSDKARVTTAVASAAEDAIEQLLELSRHMVASRKEVRFTTDVEAGENAAGSAA